ncbi:ABC transporter ATP-binding protein [Xanthobacter dioxanivorans]|uniref:ABC transporter ATP-binding protein n=1 Tax=Xanthobacter dioxanivorans TaxID=2528964 RepID=A0A974PMG0_9HYPH|nr:ABC transporter ATP-binding protein [Xanthobacter dioxanivorans]QRG06282.1 ABC transporter ATP-binding protein [Xanthobacter dioxanivorans]
MAHLVASGVGKQFAIRGRNGVEVADILKGVDLEVGDNEFVSIVGASGSGKTTFLRIVAGLAQADAGSVKVNGKTVSGPGPERAMVFQAINLLPWRNVVGNVEFGLELQKVPEAERRARAERFIELVGLGRHRHAYPHELSGGMQQRVGIARALATDPALLLMDEPFGSLDAQTAEFLWDELSKIVAETRKSVLFVTHHIDEAIYLSDRVVVLGGSPAGVREVIAIDFPKPRWAYDVRADPRFAEFRARLRAHIFHPNTSQE